MNESPHTAQTIAPHDHCIALYDALENRAVDGVFTGSISEAYKSLGISNHYYARILRALVETGSVEYVQRGHHKRPTIYKLLHRPTHEQLQTFEFVVKPSKRGSDTDILSRLDTIERRMQGIDIVAALHNLEQRIVALENREVT